jgi:hypothetical protein
MVRPVHHRPANVLLGVVDLRELLQAEAGSRDDIMIALSLGLRKPLFRCPDALGRLLVPAQDAMSYCYTVPYTQRYAGIAVQDTSILDVDPLTNNDRLVVASHR